MSQDRDDSATRRARHAGSGTGGSRTSRRSGHATGTHFAGSTTNRYKNYTVPTSYDSDGMAEQEAPRPVLDPAATGSFQRIDASMGARVETRENVSQLSADNTSSWKRTGYGSDRRLQGEYRPKMVSHEPKVRTNRKLFVGIAVAVALVLCGAAYVFHSITSTTTESESTTNSEQMQVDVDQTITYRDVTYSLEEQDDGTYAIMMSVEGESATQLATLTGTPVQLILYNGTLVVPENLNGTWDILAYTIGTGTSASQVVDEDGNPVTGEGSISSVELDGSSLKVTDDAGDTTTVSLD